MLMKCPECDLQVSDKATSCPHCGYPLKYNATQSKRKRGSNKRRRLPNGFGQISEIKGQNLRKPFRAMVTVGKTDTGRPICKILKPEGYFETYNEAYEALLKYNRDPYDLGPSITMQELYARWSVKYVEQLHGKSGMQSLNLAWKYCSEIYNMKVRDIRVRHLKQFLENPSANFSGNVHFATANIKSRIKSLLNLMLDYAVEYELTDKNYARMFSLPKKVREAATTTQQDHIAFSDWEMERLWNAVGKLPAVDVVLIQCYSGWRPTELGTIKFESVDFNNWTFTGGSKTKAGTGRVVPIHPRIRELVKKKYEEARSVWSEDLIIFDDPMTLHGDTRFTYSKYKQRFKNIVATLGLDPRHRPHDPRKTFVTMAKAAGVDEYAIKYIVGHVITDITEKVYTERDMEWLTSEMKKIK